jgi:hypothetical protein
LGHELVRCADRPATGARTQEVVLLAWFAGTARGGALIAVPSRFLWTRFDVRIDPLLVLERKK